MSTFRTFENLEAWKACRELRLFAAREIVPVLPSIEKYRLADQLIRSSRSTTANLAEGYGRFHYLEKAKFCSQSRGSVFEVLDHLITAVDEQLITEAYLARGRDLAQQADRLLNGYMKYLRSAKSSSEDSPA